MPSVPGKALCCLLALLLASPAGARAAAPTAAGAPTPRASVTAPPAASTAGPASDKAVRARDAFSEGLRLVEAGDYAAAQAAFARAHALEPHPLSLYNIGQCQARLGQHAAAVQTLEQLLAQAGDTIGAAQRQSVTQQLSELRAIVAANVGAAPAAAPSPSAPPAAAMPPPAAVQPLMIEPQRHALPPASLPPASLQPASPLASTAGTRTWGWLLSGSGAALLGSATVLYFWNDHRYDAWRTERARLESDPNREQLVQQNAAAWDRTHASNQRLASIQQVDLASGIIAGVGAATLGLGIWRLLAGDESSAEQRGNPISAAPFSWRATW